MKNNLILKTHAVQIIAAIFIFCTTASSSNMANPAVIIPEARIAVGASYHLGGYTLTNLEIPAMFNRINIRCEYTPFSFISIGLNGGATMIDVERYTIGADTFNVFHGKFGFSGGAHLKMSTPAFVKKYLRLTGIGVGSYFSSKNKAGAFYRGFDAAGIIGLQLHIPHFGYVTAGPQLYLIDGTNRSYTGEKHFYSNVNNIRGWLAIDYFPKLNEIHSTKPYISLEISVSPQATYSRRVPVQEFSVSLSVGSITKRLYGIENEEEWNP